MFVLAKSGLGFDAIDIAARGLEHGFDVAAILSVVDRCEALPDGAIFDFPGNAFEDDGFVGAIGANGAESVRGDVFCFACVWAGAEPERIFPPDTPDQHEMRAAVGTRCGDPIIVGFFEAFECPAPGL